MSQEPLKCAKKEVSKCFKQVSWLFHGREEKGGFGVFKGFLSVSRKF